MSAMLLACPHCNQQLEIPDELLGRVVACPLCSGQMQIPANNVSVPAMPVQSEPASQDEQSVRQCPFCGEQIMATAIKCKHCGEMLNQSTSAGKSKGGSTLKKVCKWIMIVWSIFCLVNVISGLGLAGGTMSDDMGEIEKSGAAIGMGCGMGFWIIVWAVIVLPTLIVWLVAGKKND